MQENNIYIVSKTNKIQPYITKTGIFIYKVTRNLNSNNYAFRVSVRLNDKTKRAHVTTLNELCKSNSFKNSEVILNSLGTKV